MNRKRVVIMGAAGRDFHDFNVVYRTDPDVEVVAFTATQIPGIANRRYPAELAGPLYPEGIPILPETDLEAIIRDRWVDSVVFAYSDVSHETVMHEASRVLATGADFELLGPRRTMIASRRPVVSVCAARTGSGKSQTTRYLAALFAERGLTPVVIRHPMPYGDLAAQARPALHDATPISTATRRPSRSARSTSPTSTPAESSTPGSTTRRSSARPRPRPTSSSGTAATTTIRSTGPISRSSSPTRSGPATSGPSIRARRASGWPMS